MSDDMAPHRWLPWLTHVDSLTEKLKDTAGDARLQVLSHGFSMTDTWDRHQLKLNHERVIHREILMWAWDIPCWYARTIIPEHTYLSDETLFSRLNKEPLGALIFSSDHIVRASMVHFPITPASSEFSWLDPVWYLSTSVLWARLSEFKLNQVFSFYLVEVLLPGLERYL